MKKLVILISMVAVALVVSCQQEEKFEQLDNEVKKEYIVSIETAKDVAFFHLHQNKNMPKTRSRNVDDIKIESTFSINDDASDPVMHIINYEDGGFAIVSGDNRIEPMLAYSDEGSFSDNHLDYPEGLVDWIEHVKGTIDYIRTNDVALPEELAKFWEATELSGKSRAIPEQGFSCIPGERFDEAISGPYLTTMWHQDSPFNTLMPTITCGGTSRNAYVGCVPLAIAQMLKYWEYPTGYNWNNMPDYTATDETRYLIHHIRVFYERYKTINYECDGTGTSGEAIDDVIKNNFGYRSATYASFNTETLMNEVLYNGRPAILTGQSPNGGDGHAWVCDGGHRWSVCLSEDATFPAVTYNYFHMNWGWAGQYNGWFNYSNFTIPDLGYNFNSNKKMVYNIIPN